jgi:hypothetical protein
VAYLTSDFTNQIYISNRVRAPVGICKENARDLPFVGQLGHPHIIINGVLSSRVVSFVSEIQ